MLKQLLLVFQICGPKLHLSVFRIRNFHQHSPGVRITGIQWLVWSSGASNLSLSVSLVHNLTLLPSTETHECRADLFNFQQQVVPLCLEVSQHFHVTSRVLTLAGKLQVSKVHSMTWSGGQYFCANRVGGWVGR